MDKPAKNELLNYAKKVLKERQENMKRKQLELQAALFDVCQLEEWIEQTEKESGESGEGTDQQKKDIEYPLRKE